MARVIESLGLDWFVLLIGKPAFEDAVLPYPETLLEVRERFGALDEDKKLEDAIDFCSNLLKREEDRSDKVESKAFTLIGITGIATGLITGFAALLLDQEKITSAWMLTTAAVLYILVVIALMWTIYLAVKVVTIGDYVFTYPSANDIFKLSVTNLHEIKRERAAALFFSFAKNHQVVNRKATFLGGAQLWFRNSIILLLATTLLLALYIPFRSSAPVPVLVPPTGLSSPTPLPLAPTDTPQPQPTQTRIMPTITPTATIITPTITDTLTP